jgi:hypothetical protein
VRSISCAVLRCLRFFVFSAPAPLALPLLLLLLLLLLPFATAALLGGNSGDVSSIQHAGARGLQSGPISWTARP